jgi:metallophosphoesterase superfamily enzyme
MLVINDLHLGVQRTAGTTPQSAVELKDYLRRSLSRLLDDFRGRDIIVNGDLLDKFEIETSEVVRVYEVFADWLRNGGHLHLVGGNHDFNPRGSKVSSFHLVTHFLQSHFGKQVCVYDKGFSLIDHDTWCIPHMPNQDLFKIETDKAVAMDGEGKYLLLHCNVKNTFAEHSDHSLNMTDEILTGLMKAGWTLIVGHEHQGYELRSGRVIVVGNQFPSSVADCIGDEDKFAIEITKAGVEYRKTWCAAESYAEIDWQELADTNASFIRVVGDATAEQSVDVVSAISKYRQKSNALVITNAVKVDGVVGMDEMAAESIEGVKSFDVLAAILENLDEREAKTVKELIDA